MTMYVDNQPHYLTSLRPEYRGIEFDVVARGVEMHLDECAAEDPTQQTLLIRVVKTVGACDVRDIRALIARAVTPSGCYCEHDCCGHRHGHAVVKMYTMDTAEVLVATSRNY